MRNRTGTLLTAMLRTGEMLKLEQERETHRREFREWFAYAFGFSLLDEQFDELYRKMEILYRDEE